MIHSAHLRLGKNEVDLLFQAFCPDPDSPQTMSHALRTISRCRDSVITIMALQRPIPKMVGERHATVRAFKGETAIRTEDKIGKPPSIEEKEALSFIFDIFLKSCSHLF
jgi:hypothetical protein